MKNKQLLFGLLGLALVASSAFGAVAFAKYDPNEKYEEGDDKGMKIMLMSANKIDKWYGEHKEMVNKKGSSLEVHINDNGSVLVRGAKVTAVSGTTITAITEWNGASVSWNLNSDANTKFINLKNGQSSVSDVKVGDFVSFSGDMMAGATFTIKAKQVKNWSVTPAVKTTVEGKIESIAGTTVPTTFTLKAGDKVYTVKLSATTSVLNAKWLTANLASFQVGNQVRVHGLVNTDNTIDATVVRNVNLQ